MASNQRPFCLLISALDLGATLADHCKPVDTVNRLFRALLQRIEALDLPYGQEDAFKLTPAGLITDRVLVGVPALGLNVDALLQLAQQEMTMPEDGLAILSAHAAQASAVFFGIENSPQGIVFKVYLEFWEQVKRTVLQRPSATPLLLHLGIKWSSARPGHHEVARYMCHPLLSVTEVMRRIVAIYPPGGQASACPSVLDIVRQGIKHRPDASLLYLEVSEHGNPRRSFDVNLYKTGITLSSCAKALGEAAGHFGILRPPIEMQLERFGHCALGHLSGGIDRHGQEFLSVYAETRPLPDS